MPFCCSSFCFLSWVSVAHFNVCRCFQDQFLRGCALHSLSVPPRGTIPSGLTSGQLVLLGPGFILQVYRTMKDLKTPSDHPCLPTESAFPSFYMMVECAILGFLRQTFHVLGSSPTPPPWWEREEKSFLLQCLFFKIYFIFTCVYVCAYMLQVLQRWESVSDPLEL